MRDARQRDMQVVWAMLARLAKIRSRQYLRAIGADLSQAEDVAQETLLALLTSANFRRAYRSPKSLWQYGRASLAKRFRATNETIARRLRTEALATVQAAEYAADCRTVDVYCLSEPERGALNAELRSEIARCLRTVTDREREVLIQLFLVDQPLTLKAIAEQYPVSPARINQIAHIGLRKLRHPTRTKRLSEFARPVREQKPREQPNIWTPLGRAMLAAIARGYRIDYYTDEELLSGRYRDCFVSIPLPMHSW